MIVKSVLWRTRRRQPNIVLFGARCPTFREVSSWLPATCRTMRRELCAAPPGTAVIWNGGKRWDVGGSGPLWSHPLFPPHAPLHRPAAAQLLLLLLLQDAAGRLSRHICPALCLGRRSTRPGRQLNSYSFFYLASFWLNRASCL